MHKLFNKYGIESSISDYQPILTDLSVMNMHHNNSI